MTITRSELIARCTAIINDCGTVREKIGDEQLLRRYFELLTTASDPMTFEEGSKHTARSPEELPPLKQTSKLLPCPFCGNDGGGPIEEALHVSHTQNDWHPAYDCYSIQCDKCTATMGYSLSEEEAIEAWNTRLSHASHEPASVMREEAAKVEPWSDVVREIVQDVAELPDRTSPDDWPDAMLVTGDELFDIVHSRIEQALAAICNLPLSDEPVKK
jgi:hypothetical protein